MNASMIDCYRESFLASMMHVSLEGGVGPSTTAIILVCGGSRQLFLSSSVGTLWGWRGGPVTGDGVMNRFF